MAGVDLGPRQLAAPGPPDLQRLGAALAQVVAAPGNKGRTANFSPGFQVRFVELPIDTAADSVVLTDRVHAIWILQQGPVLRQRLDRKRRQVARFCPALERVL